MNDPSTASRAWRRALLTADFDFDLPDSAIAQHPAGRGQSRLLVTGAPADARHRQVGDLPEILRPGDLLVVNDTRVLPARVFARRELRPSGGGQAEQGGGRVELLLVEKLGSRTWDALARPARRLRPGVGLELEGGLGAEVIAAGEGGRRRLRFAAAVEPHLERFGHVPLPPYIRRGDAAADRECYQTVFARHPGAIAAPTAGLHFTPELLAELEARGIGRAAVTLHVGYGTFKPISVDRVEDHRMDAERYRISSEAADAIRRTRAAGGRIVAVGTTVVRTLASAAVAPLRGDATLAPLRGDAALAASREGGSVPPGEASTELFIVPGFRFRVVDALVTNFHLPKSTLLMLVSAFAGRERVLAAYREAVTKGYRFYSYGDAMFLEGHPRRGVRVARSVSGTRKKSP